MECDEKTREMIANFSKAVFESAQVKMDSVIFDWEIIEKIELEDCSVAISKAVEPDGETSYRADVEAGEEFVIHKHEMFAPTPFVLEYFVNNKDEGRHITLKQYPTYPTLQTFKEDVLRLLLKIRKSATPD